MKKNARFHQLSGGIAAIVATAMLFVMLATGVFAETTEIKAVNAAAPSYDIEDESPAIYVAQKNAESVVGVITYVEMWSRGSKSATTQTYSEGSGVVVSEGGYILTNYHVVASGDSYQVLLPSGEKVDAALVGSDASYDLAVLKVADEAAAALVPAAIGSAERLSVGSTVVAIGNPGGETLFNTVTQGIISSLSRAVDGGNTSRSVAYLQHDAAINSGNSGGGLFDINGNLIGINTLKYGGGLYSGRTFEGLGFAIPIETAYPIAVELIEKGKVARVGIGVSVVEVGGAEEATDDETPAGLQVRALVAGGPAETAGVQTGDYITAINDIRVKSMKDLTKEIDAHEAGDVVTLTVVRYTPVDAQSDGMIQTSGRGSFSFPFGGFGSPFGGFYQDERPAQKYRAETLKIEVTLQILD
jgi:serine protease Do